MLKHGRAGVPMEVMGLMLGEFVDPYTITCVDVFAMPQSGTVSAGMMPKSCDSLILPPFRECQSNQSMRSTNIRCWTC